MALKVNPMEPADRDAVLGLQDHIIPTDTADLTVHTKKDITGGMFCFVYNSTVCLLFFMRTLLFTLQTPRRS